MKSLGNKIFKRLGIKISKIGHKNDVDLYTRLYGKESVVTKRFYNVSAGGHAHFEHVTHPLWRKLDVINDSGPQKCDDIIGYDMLNKDSLPIESNSAEIILTQYAIEHVSTEGVEHFFKESFRALKTGGILRIVAPNPDLDYLAYSNNNRDFYSWQDWMGRNFGFKSLLKEATFEQLFISHVAGIASEMHIGNNPIKISDEEFKDAFHRLEKDDLFEYCTSRCSLDTQKNYRMNHFNWWTHDKIKLALKKSGFKNVYSMYPHLSSAKVLRNNRFFDNKWNDVALFIETVK